jgi:hypothetical protein
MFLGGSFRCSPITADSRPPDVSVCAGMVGSHGVPPKLSPLFRSEKHAQRLSNFDSQVTVTKALFALSPAESAHPQNAPATPAESALPFLLDLKPTRINTYEKILRWEGDGLCSLASTRAIVFCSGGLSRLVPSFEGVSREFRGSSEGPSGRRPWFFGCPTSCALCNKWVSGLQLSCGSIAPQGQHNEHLRKNGRGVPPVQEIRITRQLESGGCPKCNRWERQSVV